MRTRLCWFLCAFICVLKMSQASNLGSSPRTFNGANRFGLRLLSQLVQEQPHNRNFVVSPVSVQLALAMAYAGAEGATAAAMADTLGWSGTSREQLLELQSALQASLKNPGSDVVLRIANAVWVDEGAKLQPTYAQAIEQGFGSEIFSRSFRGSGLVGEINRWVDRQTLGKITQILTEPPPPPLCLVDAVYFKAPWKSPFESRSNARQPFFLQDGRQVDVVMMRNQAFLAHSKTDAFEAVRLPYAGDRFGLVLLLPKSESTVQALIERLADRPWSELDQGFQEARCDLTIPKFRVDYEAQLQMSLKQLGMAAAFDPAVADFRRMLEDESPLYIQSVIHKTFLRVDEAGSEAAAVTAVVMPRAALPEQNAVKLVFDRPFVFAIVDQTSHTILFAGILGDPEGTQP
jgi:serine protease inhibitor